MNGSRAEGAASLPSRGLCCAADFQGKHRQRRGDVAECGLRSWDLLQNNAAWRARCSSAPTLNSVDVVRRAGCCGDRLLGPNGAGGRGTKTRRPLAVHHR